MKDILVQSSTSEGWLSPLRYGTFRTLLIVWMVANICMWMNDVAAAWTMTSLTKSATLIALVQTASSLPVLLLGVPSGALADIVNRKHYFVFTQVWLAINASALMLCMVLNVLNPHLLLILTFINGVGLAMRWPIFAAIIPDLVPRDSLSSALALNAIAMNTARIIGPLVAGAIIATAGSQYVFALNMVLSLVLTFVVMRWKYDHQASALPGERLIGAMRVGMQFVWQSSRMKIITIRAFLFFFQSTSIIALLPVIAKYHFKGDANTFTLLLSCLGVGAILGGSQLPRIKNLFNTSDLMNYGLILLIAASCGVVFAPNVWIASPLMIICGIAWIGVANSLTTSAQLTLPGWVRARGMSIYQMSLMGGSAFGAATCGKIAEEYGVGNSIIASSIFGLTALFFIRKYRIDSYPLEDFTPASPIDKVHQAAEVDVNAGPVMISIEYHTEERQKEEFKKLMSRTRKSHLKQGALSWSLFEDAEHKGRFFEYFIFQTWADYLRRFDRFTTEDLQMQEECLRLHIDIHPPKITRRVASTIKSNCK